MARNKIDSAGMRIAVISTVTMALVSLMSCGGTATGGAAGTIVAATFSGSTMPSAVAYQVGTTGTFQAIALTGSSVSFTLPSGIDAYGLAYLCPTLVDVNPYSNESIIQAATSDTTSLSLACPSQSGVINATFDASAIPGATSVVLYASYMSAQIYETSGSVGLQDLPSGTFDVALVAQGPNGVLALQIKRGVSITPSTTTIAFPPMTAADEFGNAPISITDVPSNSTASGFSVTYNTSGGTSIVLPGPFSGVPQSTYRTAPVSQRQSGDFYLYQAIAVLPAQFIQAEMSSNTAELSSNTSATVTVALPSPLGTTPAPVPAAFPTFTANASGFTVAGTVVNSSWVQFQTSSVNPTVCNLYTYVTKAWLGANTTFSTPDLSTLPGFMPAPPTGGTEHWTLYSTAGTPFQLNPMQQSGVEALTSLMSVQFIQYGGDFTTP